MNIFPAIDLFEHKAVRLYKGDYNKMTVYSDNPEEIALDFKKNNAKFIHIVDLEGAKTGKTPNIETIKKIKNQSGLFCEIGGGIRSMDVIESYISSGIDRVIIGTAAVSDKDFLYRALDKYQEKIAVGVDIKDSKVAIKGWVEKSEYHFLDFFYELEKANVKTVICTDITKDGAMQGTNHSLYHELKNKFNINIIASGGVSDINDIIKLKNDGIYGAIIGKAYYTKAINLKEAIEVANK